MKRIISILSVILLLSAFVFADSSDDGDEYDDGYVYEQNGAGDQFITIELGACFPLNFGKQLYVGGLVSLGYFKFIGQYLALGGDVLISYNLTVGQKPLLSVPITFGAMYQPYIGRFEFPLSLSIGFASISCQSMSYFPAFASKFSAGAFLRYSESWSFGIESKTFWIPQWFLIDEKTRGHKADNGFFTSAGLSVRYHF